MTQLFEMVFQWWDRIDLDYDGFVSPEEWTSERFTSVPFDLVDVDGNGQIDWDPEFMAFTISYVQGRMFLIAADTNTDGSLSSDEWAALVSSDPDTPPLADVDGIIANQADGLVTADEMVYLIIQANQFLEYEPDEDETGSDACVSPPAWCPGQISGLTLGNCRTFQTTSLTGERTCSKAARWQGGIVAESKSAIDAIFALFDSDPPATTAEGVAGDELLTTAEITTITEEYTGGMVPGGYATGLEMTFADIDANSDGSVSKDELYKYLLRGGDKEGRWFAALFDKDCNGMFQAEEARSFCMYSPCESQMPIFGTYSFLKMTSVTPVYCPYVRSGPQISRELLWPFLAAMKFVAERNTDPPASTTSPLQAINLGSCNATSKTCSDGEWTPNWDTIQSSEILRSAYAGTGIHEMGPAGIFFLIQGLAGAIPQGWTSLLLDLYDDDASGTLQRTEALSVLWMTDDIFNFLGNIRTTRRRADTDSLSASDINIRDGFQAWTRANVIFPNADRPPADGVLDEDEWNAAFGDDPEAPSFGKMDANGDGVVDLSDFLNGTKGGNALSYPRCALDDPCADCVTWDAGYGPCSSYGPGEINDGNCFAPTEVDKYGIFAYQACPIACAGNQQLICAPNLAESRSFNTEGFPVEPSQIVAATMSLPGKALKQGTAIGAIRTMYTTADSDVTRTLEKLWTDDPVFAEEVLQAPYVPVGFVGSRNAGLNGTILNVDVRGPDPAPDLNSDVEYQLGVDPCLLRRASGCADINLGTLRLCAAGKVGIYNWDTAEKYWKQYSPPDANTTDTGCGCANYTAGTCSQVEMRDFKSSKLQAWTMLMSSPVCCNYNDTAKSCTSRVCRTSVGNPPTTHAYLGQGTGTKMPYLKPSNRPVFDNGQRTWTQMRNLFENNLNRSKANYVPRSGWLQLCINGLHHVNECQFFQANAKKPGANWFFPRFGHATAAVSGSRVLVYGGFGCLRATPIPPAVPQTCVEYYSFSDLWEIVLGDVGSVGDTTATVKYEYVLVRELSPLLSPMGGGMAVPLYRESHRMFVIGGANKSIASMILSGSTREATGESFMARELRVRDRIVDGQQASVVPSITGHSVVANESQAILFGGFVSNAITSGVFSYDLDKASADTAFGTVKIQGGQPEFRAFGHLTVLNAEQLMLLGGMYTAVNDSGVGLKRVGYSDAWTYNLVNRRWTEVDLASNGQVQPTAFEAGYQTIMGDDEIFFLAHGGVTVEYMPGLSTNMRIGSRARNPYPPYPRRAPTNDFRVLVPESWVVGTNMTRWMRIRPRLQKPECISAQPLCNSGSAATTDPYWSCVPTPLPWWTQVKERVSPCTWIKTQYLPPANDAACARQIDPETRSCVLPLPPAMTCEPPPRFMHTVTAGKLMGGKDAAVVYGGVSSTGELLSDMWMYPLYDTFPTTMACENCGWVVRAVVFAKIANLVCDQRSIVQFKRLVSTMTTGSDSNSAMVHYDIIRSPSTSLNPAQPICQYSCTNERWVFSTYSDSNPSAAAASTTREASEVLLTLKISITNPKNYYDMQVKCASVGGCKELYAEAVQALYKDTECTNPANPNVNNCPLAGSALLRFETVAGEELSRCYRRVIGRTPPSPAGAQTFFFSEFQKTCLLYREARVDAFDLDSQIDCTENCVRGYCQFQDIARYEDQPVQCEEAGPCAGDGWCSLPGPRSGHSATTFLYLNSRPAILIFGGETTQSLADNHPASPEPGRLLNDVLTGIFQGSSLSMARLRTICSVASPCPLPRRDASVTIIDSSEGSSGKLVVFGGLTGTQSSADYFVDDTRFLSPLDDIWVLDLDQINRQGLGEQCLTAGQCVTDIFWVELQVEGGRPLARFGAALTVLDLDKEGILYLQGGATKSDSRVSIATTEEITDLYTFRLRDPFYRRCAATGQGLAKAVAGAKTGFTVACADILGQPAIGALIRVSIVPGATCNGCPSVFPPVITVGVGLYFCEFTPRTAGDYLVSIVVGRGGEEFQDAVGGDPFAQATLVVEEIVRQNEVVHGTDGFQLSVNPAPTDRPETRALGSAITLSTAGVSQQFIIRAVDAFQNRRPGGEDISVIMGLAGSNDVPESGKVEDNSDGTYNVQYSLTLAGAYKVTVAIAGVTGAGSPFDLTVQAQESDPLLTYAYGQLLSGKTGVGYSIFVQTRDKYGNYISADPEVYPDGQDTISFEACESIGTLDCRGQERGQLAECTACSGPGGKLNNDLAIRIDYAEGPLGDTKANGVDKYLGLYKITYLPLQPASITPLIRHNNVYIQCYFDSDNANLETLADPVEAADNCVERRLLEELTAEARRGITGERSLVHATGTEQRHDFAIQFTHPTPAGNRRNLDDDFDPLKDTDKGLTVEKTFTPPDVDTAQMWLWLAPLLCAATGLGLYMCTMLVEFLYHRKHQKHLAELEQHHDLLREAISQDHIAGQKEETPSHTLAVPLPPMETEDEPRQKAITPPMEQLQPEVGVGLEAGAPTEATRRKVSVQGPNMATRAIPPTGSLLGPVSNEPMAAEGSLVVSNEQLTFNLPTFPLDIPAQQDGMFSDREGPTEINTRDDNGHVEHADAETGYLVGTGLSRRSRIPEGQGGNTYMEVWRA